jgi:serine acetyltransferase
MPTIGNNVVIYKGDTIVGGGKIDDDTIIPAHSFIKLQGGC